MTMLHFIKDIVMTRGSLGFIIDAFYVVHRSNNMNINWSIAISVNEVPAPSHFWLVSLRRSVSLFFVVLYGCKNTKTVAAEITQLLHLLSPAWYVYTAHTCLSQIFHSCYLCSTLCSPYHPYCSPLFLTVTQKKSHTDRLLYLPSHEIKHHCHQFLSPSITRHYNMRCHRVSSFVLKRTRKNNNGTHVPVRFC